MAARTVLGAAVHQCAACAILLARKHLLTGSPLALLGLHPMCLAVQQALHGLSGLLLCLSTCKPHCHACLLPSPALCPPWPPPALPDLVLPSLASAPRSAPSVATITVTTPTSAMLTINPSANTSSTTTSYTVSLAPTGTAPTTVTCTNPSNCQLIGLTSSVSYTVSVVADFADGTTSPGSAQVSFNTPPLTAPTVATAVATGPTQAAITTTTPPTGGPFVSYTFTVNAVGTTTSVVTTVAQTLATITGLSASTQYSVSVTATDSSGTTTPASNQATFTTPSIR